MQPNHKIVSATFYSFARILSGIVFVTVYAVFSGTFRTVILLCMCRAGALIAYHDFACFKAIKQFGAEIVSSVLPLSTGMLFVFWLLIEPSTVTRYLADKPQFILISSSIGGIIYSVCKYNHQPESSAALRYMWLMLFVAMMINMLNKIAAMHGGTSPMVISIYYAFVSSLTVGVINTFLLIKNVKGKPHIDISLIFKPKILGLYILLLLSMIFKNVAMNSSPDPTYVAALIYLSILWIILGNYVLDRLRLISSYPHAKWRYVALLVFSSIILILVTGTHNS